MDIEPLKLIGFANNKVYLKATRDISHDELKEIVNNIISLKIHENTKKVSFIVPENDVEI